MEVVIRPADELDFPAIFSLIKEFSIFQGTPEKVSITVEQMLGNKDLFHCLVAETTDKRIIGFASFFFAYYSWSGRALYLDDLYVKEAFRKQAIGKMLFEAVLAYAKENNCNKMRWLVSKWNTNAIGFYKSIGAKIDETDLPCDLTLNNN